MYHQIRCKPGPVKWQPENSKNNEQQLSKTDKQLSVKSQTNTHLPVDCQTDPQLSVNSQSNTDLPGDCHTEEQLSKSDEQLPVLSQTKNLLSDNYQDKFQLSNNSQNSLQLPVPSPEDDSEPEIVFISCPLKLKSGDVCGKQFSKPGL